MNTILKFSMLVVLLVFGSAKLQAQTDASTETIVIKTSAECEMCKTRIEKNLNVMNGVKSAVVDFEAHTITVVYQTKRTTPEKIRKTVSSLGYDADNVQAKKGAYKRLPECCKKGAGSSCEKK